MVNESRFSPGSLNFIWIVSAKAKEVPRQ